MKMLWLTASWARDARLAAGCHAALSAAMRKMRRIRIGIRKQEIDARLD